MYKSKFIEIYTCLNSQELEALHKWVKSPLHNSDQKVIDLFIFLASRRKISAVSVKKERLFEALYPEQEYNDLQVRHLLSKSTKTLEEFVQFWMLKKDEILLKKKLTEFLHHRKRPKLANQQLDKNELLLTQQSFKSHDYYYQTYQLEQERFEQTAAQSRTEKTNLQSIFDNFSIAFIIENLRYACIAVSHQNLYKTNYTIPFLEEMLKATQQSPYLEVPVIQMYYFAYQSLAEIDSHVFFQSLKQGLIEHATLLPPKELRNLYTLAINYCIKRINSSESTVFMREVFELYKQGMADKALLEQGILSKFTYKNIMTAGLQLHEFDWVKEHIPTYAVYVEEPYRANYQHYNTAKWHYAKGDYKTTMKLLTQVDYDDLFLNLDAKTMLMKIYYENESYEALDSFFHSFTIYLQRKDIMGYHKQNYLNIIKLTKKLISLVDYDKATCQKLEQEIKTVNPLTERAWLLVQIEKK